MGEENQGGKNGREGAGRLIRVGLTLFPGGSSH